MLPTGPPGRRGGSRGYGSAVPSAESTAAELASIADNVDQYRSRVAALAEPFIGTDRDDLVSAIYEAERQLRIAERTLQRAIKMA